MTTDRRRAANRRNAAHSTGPRSAAGKTRSSKNSLRHGLASQLGRTAGQSAEIEGLANAIAGTNPTPEVLHLAQIVAESEFDLIRIRAARVDFINQAAAEPATFAPDLLVPKKTIEGLRKAASAPAEIIAALQIPPSETLRWAEQWNEYRLTRPLPNVDDRPAVAFGRACAKIARYGRYERRALARRKRALRGLDQLRFLKKVT